MCFKKRPVTFIVGNWCLYMKTFGSKSIRSKVELRENRHILLFLIFVNISILLKAAVTTWKPETFGILSMNDCQLTNLRGLENPSALSHKDFLFGIASSPHPRIPGVMEVFLALSWLTKIWVFEAERDDKKKKELKILFAWNHRCHNVLIIKLSI